MSRWSKRIVLWAGGNALWQAAQEAPYKTAASVVVTGVASVWAWFSDLAGLEKFVLVLAAAALSIWGMNGILYLTDLRRTRGRLRHRGVEKANAFTAAPRPRAIASQLAGDVIQGVHLRLVDVPMDGVIIRNKTFIDCNIEGPAICAAVGKASWLDSTFAEGEDAVYWVREKGQLTGAIGLDNCHVLQSRIAGVGIVGTEEQVRGWKSDPTNTSPTKGRRRR